MRIRIQTFFIALGGAYGLLFGRSEEDPIIIRFGDWVIDLTTSGTAMLVTGVALVIAAYFIGKSIDLYRHRASSNHD